MSQTTLASAYPVSFKKAVAVGDLLVSTVKAHPLLWVNFFQEPGIVDNRHPELAKIRYDYWSNSTTRKGVRRLRVRVWLVPGNNHTARTINFIKPTTSELLTFHRLLANLELIALQNIPLESSKLIYYKQNLKHPDSYQHHSDILWSYTIFYKSHKYTKSER